MVWRRLREAKRVLAEAEADHTVVPARTERSLASEVFVVLVDPERETFPQHGDVVVSSALMWELVQEGRLEVTGKGRKATVQVVDRTPLGDAQLDDALLHVAAGLFGKKLFRLIVWDSSEVGLRQRLVREGAVVLDTSRSWGQGGPRIELQPTSGRDVLDARIRSALVGESVPDYRTRVLIGLLLAGGGIEYFAPRWKLNATLRSAREIVDGLTEADRDFLDAVKAAAARARRFDD